MFAGQELEISLLLAVLTKYRLGWQCDRLIRLYKIVFYTKKSLFYYWSRSQSHKTFLRNLIVFCKLDHFIIINYFSYCTGTVQLSKKRVNLQLKKLYKIGVTMKRGKKADRKNAENKRQMLKNFFCANPTSRNKLDHSCIASKNCSYMRAGKPDWRGRLSTVDLLLLISLD